MQREEVIQSIDRGLRAAGHLRKYLMTGLSEEMGCEHLNRTHYRTLLFLSSAGSNCMTGVRRHLGLEAGSFTPVVDRLIDEGLIKRERDRDDRRRIVLQITEDGNRMASRVREVINRRINQKLSLLDDRDVNELAEILDSLASISVRILGEQQI